MSHEQMIWATKHDWFLYAFERDGRIWIAVAGTIECKRFFDSYSELRIWAGY